jgi:hypothetical protein
MGDVEMNAYELADKVDLEPYGIYGEQAANMLRQQADRIERKKELIREQTALLVKQNNRIAELEKSQMAWYEAGKFVTPQIKELSDRELVVFLMDEIDRASEWLVDGETHMAIGVLGQCHAKIRKHLSNTKESE